MTVSGQVPEKTAYRDTGCAVAPSCFACPLPDCRYVAPKGRQSATFQLHSLRVIELTQDGKGRAEIAEDVGVTVRTVSRIRELAR